MDRDKLASLQDGATLKSAFFFKKKVLTHLKWFCLIIPLSYSLVTFAKPIPTLKSKEKKSGVCSDKKLIQIKIQPDLDFIICDKNVIIAKKSRLIRSLPVEVTWESQGHSLPPTIKKFSTPLKNKPSFLVEQTNDFGDGMYCASLFTVSNEDLVAGPAFCMAGEGYSKELKVVNSENTAKINIEEVVQDLSGVEVKTTSKIIEKWEWKNNSWIRTFKAPEEKSE